jgi:hypothetical protein
MAIAGGALASVPLAASATATAVLTAGPGRRRMGERTGRAGLTVRF